MTARTAAESTTIERRPPARASIQGPMRGATTAKGAMVRSRYSATRVRAASGEMEKNSDPARAVATKASPAVDRAWVRARRANGGGTATGGGGLRSARHPAGASTAPW